MTFARPEHSIYTDTLPRMPAWVTSARPEAFEDVAFLSGAALNHLHLVLGREEVPKAVLRDRLALRAAEACVGFSGRPKEPQSCATRFIFCALAIYLVPRGNLPCLASRGGTVGVGQGFEPSLPTFESCQIATWLDAGHGAPVTRAVVVLDAVLTEAPRAEVPALILADAALAEALGWDHVVPLLAAGLKRADLRKLGHDLRLACHRAVTASAVEATRLAVDLARRAALLKGVAPKLRAKGRPTPSRSSWHRTRWHPVPCLCRIAQRGGSATGWLTLGRCAN